MRKVSIFQSIHVKFALIYILLILIMMQIIGAYFVRQLEAQLVENFKNSLNERVILLAYNIEQEMNKERDKKSPTIEEEIRSILQDFVSQDISEVRVIDHKSKVLGTSNPYNQNIVGKRMTDLLIKRTLVAGEMTEKCALTRKQVIACIFLLRLLK